MAGRFVLRRHQAPGSDAAYTFQLLGDDNRLLLSGESYRTRSGAARGIEAVRRLAPGADVVEEMPAGEPTGPASPAARGR
jgi:uncharacterized protein YegP (UPF0339 family)